LGNEFFRITHASPVSFIDGKHLFLPSDIEEKINSFADLPDGWDYGSGGPIDRNALEQARLWNFYLSSQAFDYTDAFAGSEGKVTIVAGRGDHYIEVIIHTDQTYSVAYDYKRKQKFYRLRQSIGAAMQSVQEALGEIWSASTSSIRESLTLAKINSPAMPSQIIKDRYLSLELNASKTLMNLFAPTSENIMDTWYATSLANPLFFGDSTQTNFQKASF
jgi:hypothetical protein